MVKQRTDQRPYDAPPATAPVQRGRTPWPETGAAPEASTPYTLKFRKVLSLLKRVIALECAEAEQPLPARVQLVIELDLGETCEQGIVTAHYDHASPAEELASLGAGLALLLRRNVREGEDFRIVTREEQEVLDKIA